MTIKGKKKKKRVCEVLCESQAGQRAAAGSGGARSTGSPPGPAPPRPAPGGDTGGWGQPGRVASEGLTGPDGPLKRSDSSYKHRLACSYLEQCKKLIKKPSEHASTEGSALSNGSGNVLYEQPD